MSVCDECCATEHLTKAYNGFWYCPEHLPNYWAQVVTSINHDLADLDCPTDLQTILDMFSRALNILGEVYWEEQDQGEEEPWLQAIATPVENWILLMERRLAGKENW